MVPKTGDQSPESVSVDGSEGVYQGPNPEAIDRLIHEPARLLIVANLFVVEEADFTFLMNQTGLTWGNLSSHLSKLETAGYVDIEKSFVGKRPYTLVRLTDAGRDAFQSYRVMLSQVFNDLPS